VIHALFHAPIRSEKGVDGRVKPGHDEEPLAVKTTASGMTGCLAD